MKGGTWMRRYKSERAFQTVVILILTVCALAAFLPVLLVVIGSFSGEETLAARGYRLWPRAWSLSAYRYLLGFQGGKVCRAYRVSAVAVGVGTALHLLLAPLLAWPLARRDYPRRRVLTALVLLALPLSRLACMRVIRLGMVKT